MNHTVRTSYFDVISGSIVTERRLVVISFRRNYDTRVVGILEIISNQNGVYFACHNFLKIMTLKWGKC